MTYTEADALLRSASGRSWRIAPEEDVNWLDFSADWDVLKVYLEQFRVERTWLGKLVDKVLRRAK